MSAINTISFVSIAPIDAKFLVADGETRDITLNLYTYKWWSPVPGVAVFHIRTSFTAGPCFYVVLTPSGQEIRPIYLGNSNQWSVAEFAFRVTPTRPYIQFVVCPYANTGVDSVNLEGTNCRMEHAALSDITLEGVPTLVSAPRLYSPDETLEACSLPVLPPR